MNTRKRLAAIAAVTASLVTGSVAGAVLGAPTTSVAQEATPDPSATVTPAPGDRPDGPGRHHGPRGGRPNLAVVATALGVTEAELKAELRAGQAIAQVADSRGVALQGVIDALVADATEHIDQAVADGDLTAERAEALKAELPDRMTHFVNRAGGPGRGGPGGPGRGGPGRVSLAVAAEALGVSEADLHAALHDGQSMADVAEAQGVAVQTVVDALIADATARIDEKLAAGDITQQQADELKAALPERIATIVNRDGPPHPGHGGHGPGPEAETSDTASGTTTSA